MAGETVLTVGGGGREHAYMISFEEDGRQQLSTQGNAGMEQIGGPDSVLGISPKSIDAIAAAAEAKSVDLLVVGPETPLIAGLADVARSKGIATLGFNAAAARLEGSKAFAVGFASRHGIAIPESSVISELGKGIAYSALHHPQSYVIKADGEAGGKGVILPEDENEARTAFHDMLSGKLFEGAGRTVVVQERLHGPEVSMFALLDGNRKAIILGDAQDHKRLFDGDTGPNTGGMGAYSPVPSKIANAAQIEMMEATLEKTVEGMEKEGIASPGLLYMGFMLAEEYDNNPVLMEYNVRFGDPEAQVLLTLLQEEGVDLYELFDQAAHGALDGERINRIKHLTSTAALTVCLAGPDYPNSSSDGEVIHGLDKDYRDVIIHHGGTRRREDGKIVTKGGRVLYVTGLGRTLDAAADAAYHAIGQNAVWFRGARNREDIGYQALVSI